MREVNFEVIESLDKFFYSDKFISLVVGPVGCVSGDTLVVTEDGATPIRDIDRPTRVLSWNEKTGKYQLSLSGGSFPKGRDYLYRVCTPEGEFDAAGSHLLLCADGEYRRVSELQAGDVLATCSHSLPQTSSAPFPAVLNADAQRYSRTDVSCLGGYAALARRCGRPFLQAPDTDPALAPEPAGARKPTQASFFHTLSRAGALLAQTPWRTRCGLSAAHQRMTGFVRRTGDLISGAGGRISSEFCGYGGGFAPEGPLFRSTSGFRPQGCELGRSVQGLGSPWRAPSCGVTYRPITMLTRKQIQEPYWDMQVLGTQNYVTVDGAIHHNSTKTTAGIMKILHHAAIMAPCDDGIRRSRCVWIRNTREQLRDTSIPDFLKWIRQDEMGVFLKTEYKFLIKVGDIECEVLFRGLDDQNDVRRLLSLQASFIIFDEFREINPDIYNAAQGRVGRYPDKMMNTVGCVRDDGKPNAHIWGMTNPPDQDTFWEELLSDPPKNVEVTIQPSGLSPEADWTKFLPDDYYDNLAEGKTEDWIAVYIHAEFGKSLSGQPVFKSFDRGFHVAKEPLTPMFTSNPLLIGVDAGLTPAAVIGQQIHDGRVVIYDALTSTDMGALRFIREKLKPVLTNKFPGRQAVVIIDPAAFQRVQTDERCVADIYKAEGFLVKPARTNSIAARLAAVEKYLTRVVDGKAGFLVDPQDANMLVQALAGKYRYKINTKGVKDDKPDKSHPWSDLCFVAGTPIATPEGPVPVEDLHFGDQVCVPDGVDTVVGTGSHEAEQLVELEFSDGTTLTCTPDHPFYVKSHSCFLRADTLAYEHVMETMEDGVWASGASPIRAGTGWTKHVNNAATGLLSRAGNWLKGKGSTALNSVTDWRVAAKMGLRLTAFGSAAPGRIITTGTSAPIKPRCHSTSTSGSAPTGRFLKAIRSTTSTTIRGTTSWATSKLLGTGSMHACTSSSGLKTARSTTKPRLRKPAKRRKLGIGPQRGASGTASTLLLPCGSAEKRSIVAKCAERLISAAFVKRTCGTTAPLRVIRRSFVGSGRVYNLTTRRTHLYYAGGILVHNCDGLQYLCLHADGGETFGASIGEERREVVKVSASGWT